LTTSMFEALTQAGFFRLLPGARGVVWGALLWAFAFTLRAQGDVNLTEGVDAEKLDAVAFIPISDMLANKVNDLASWYDAQEDQTYLLAGCDNGTAFYKLLPGARPIYMGKLPTQSVTSLWRDIKVVHNHAYVVSEAPVHGMQVLNLEAFRTWDPLDGPVVWMPDTVVGSPSTAHNLVAFEEGSMVIQVGGNFMNGGAVLFDVSAPGTPVLVGGAGEWGSFHDAHALTYNGPDSDHVGKDLLFAAGSGKLWILDITDPTDIGLVSSASYPDAHFSHQVWVSDTHDHAFLGDELDETSEGTPTRTFVFDLTDLDTPTVAEVFEAATGASDHNQYTHGEWLFQSNYKAGLRMLSDAWPETPVLAERGHFDPMNDTDSPGFQGAWSHVILEEEGVVAFTSIQQGLWVVRPRFARLTNVAITGCQASTVPDPNTWSMTLAVDSGWAFPVEVEVEGVVFLPGQTTSWTLEEPGSVLLFFEAWGLPGVQPHVNLTSQRSTWSLNILTADAFWPAHYADEDGDGYGNPYMPVWGCGDVPGTSALPLDCQDWNANTYPSAPELCDGWNNDCDDEVDEGTSQLAWYLDVDGDGFGSLVAPVEYSCTALNQRVLVPGDCNDNEAAMYPGAPTFPDGMDNDCNGLIEEGELNPCMGDFDLDGTRTIGDMLHLLSSFGCTSGCTASLNGSDSVYTDDLLLWLGVFGLDCD
jgi:choice-of-anchor B domain-containing protein